LEFAEKESGFTCAPFARFANPDVTILASPENSCGLESGII
jgi:hypothetical protein